MAIPLSNLGSVYLGESNYSESLHYFLESLKYATDNYPKGIGDAFNNMGWNYYRKGNFIKAKE